MRDLDKVVNLEFENLKREISKTSQDLAELNNNAITYRGYIDFKNINKTIEPGYYFVEYLDNNGNNIHSGVLIVIPAGVPAKIFQFYKSGFSEVYPWYYRNTIDSDSKWTPWCKINFTL